MPEAVTVTVTGTEQDILERRARLLGPAYRLFYEEPFHPVRGEGVWLYDGSGRPFLDAYNNVVCVGHARPEVVEAIARQGSILNTHTRYLHTGILDYAERLLATMPPEIGNVTFTCTGSEANDLAMRVARAHTGGTGLIVTDWAYHGVTSAIAEASPSLGQHIVLGANVRTVAAPRFAAGVSTAEAGRVFADGVRRAVADLLAHGIRPAALMVDTVFSSDGVLTGPAGFLAEAVEVIRAAGGVFIADEVQPGFGRTGERFWGFLRHGVVPDMVSMGKPMGNGHPVAGLAVRPEVMAAFGRQSRYFNTFGGNPVSMAAASAVLDVIQKESLQANALDVGGYLLSLLSGLAGRHACISEVRGCGLFIGVELSGGVGFRVVNDLRRDGVLLSATGPLADTLKIRPPLVFQREHAEVLVAKLDYVLSCL